MNKVRMRLHSASVLAHCGLVATMPCNPNTKLNGGRNRTTSQRAAANENARENPSVMPRTKHDTVTSTKYTAMDTTNFVDSPRSD
jgi:hypothetical protein